MTDKRDLVLNQAKEILLNLLKDHKDNELCAYAYLELTLGDGIEEYNINYIKNEILTIDGVFRVKKYNPRSGKNEHYSMDDLLDFLIHFLSGSLRVEVLGSRGSEIIGKYGYTTYSEGIEYYLKEVLLGIKEERFNEYYNSFEKMIEEYILRA